MSSIQAINPATGENMGEIPVMEEAEVKMAINRARVAQESWAQTSFIQRKKIILSARGIILKNIDSIAELISKENGKPILESISHDIMPVMDLMTYFATKTEPLLKKEKICLGKWSFLGHKS